jgi:hypothetical protein
MEYSMKSWPVRYCAVYFLLSLCGAAVAWSTEKEVPPFDAAERLSLPDRTDFPWKVSILKDGLTLQQRYIVQVQVTIDPGRLEQRAHERDFHFVLKIAGADDRWVDGHSYTHIPVPPGLDRSYRVTCVSSVYLRPGRYTVAIIAHDSTFNRWNIRRSRVTVPRLKKDPLPELDRDLLDTEFIAEVPQNPPKFAQPLWALAKGKEFLPVANSRPLCVDIVVNTSSDYNNYWRKSAWGFDYRVNALRMLQVASVLSRLQLRSGCVRISIFDAFQMKMLFDREDASDFDWQHASEVVAKQNRTTIEADLLDPQMQPAAFLQNALQRISDDARCSTGNEPASEIVIVVSRELLFPKPKNIEPVLLTNPDSIRYFYFCVTEWSYADDDLLKILKPTNPRRFSVLTPLAFRTALAEMISSLEQPK